MEGTATGERKSHQPSTNDRGSSVCLTVLGVECTDCLDLSWPYNEDTIYWPGGEGFKLCMQCGPTVSPVDGAEFFYAAGSFSSAEHGGTHVDAPWHFDKDGTTVDQISLRQLVAPCCLIDISQKVDAVMSSSGPSSSSASSTSSAVTKTWNLTPADIEDWEALNGQLPQGCIVVVRTGWAERWSQGTKSYLGYDEKTQGPFDPNVSSLSFPSLEPDAAKMLVSRKVYGVGVDTASIDEGCSKDFAVHRILLGAGVYGIENLNADVRALPATGSTLFVMPMKLGGGSGAPARVAALVPKNV